MSYESQEYSPYADVIKAVGNPKAFKVRHTHCHIPQKESRFMGLLCRNQYLYIKF